MAELWDGDRSRVDALRDEHEAFGCATHDAVVRAECTRGDDLRVYESGHDKPRGLSWLSDHPSELGQTRHSVGVDRSTKVGVIDRATSGDGMHPSHRLDGRAFPDRQQAQQLSREPHCSACCRVTAS